jgi:acyl carrier protein
MTIDQGRSDIWTSLTDVFRGMFGDEALVLSSAMTAQDVEGWDSLAHVQLVIAIEERFGVRFNTGETIAVQNVGQLVEMIAAKKEGRSGASGSSGRR